MQTSMNAYVKWLTRRGEAFEDKEKGLPASYLGRTMISHGEDFENDSEFGNSLIGTLLLMLGGMMTMGLTREQQWDEPTSACRPSKNASLPMPQRTGSSRSRDLLP